MYVIGGFSNNAGRENDVWRSTDGKEWKELISDERKFTARTGHQVVVFKDAIYVIGGTSSTGPKNDVWSSRDGLTWTEETDNARFFARNYHRVVVFKSAIYLIGGTNSAGKYKKDVWGSTDGKTWVRTAIDALSLRDAYDYTIQMLVAF